MRSVNLGVLLGLGDWRQDVLTLALHGRWLQRHYPEVQIGFSLPRMRPAADAPYSPQQVSDRDFVQALLALRLWMPQADLTLSTREPAPLRDALASLGITRMSAGSSTRVGGYTRAAAEAEDQFEISDGRSLLEMRQVLSRAGLDPVTQDWTKLRGGPAVE
jgi:2-iminoacetate synthase